MMMKIHLVSDIHTEFAPYPFKQPEGTDVVIAAGDIAVGDKAPKLLREAFGDTVPIIYVAGNHEYYRQGMQETKAAISEQAEIYNVDYLENTVREINGVVFVGGTLWTDYCLWGIGEQEYCKRVAKDGMNDFRLINYKNNPCERFTPTHAEQEHKETLDIIKLQLQIAKDHNQKCVVVTHMAPSPLSINPIYSNAKDKWLNASYASDLEKLILEYQPCLWVHGHMHDNSDYLIDQTRVVCNPRGYSQSWKPEESQNKEFNKDLLIEV